MWLLYNAGTISAQQIPDVPAAFNQIPDTPTVYHFRKGHFRAPLTGHIQGIQGWSDGKAEKVVMTANSANYSYYVIATLNKNGDGKIEGLHHLLQSPYRHAGGCQLDNGKLYVGVEDNKRKDKSKLLVVSLQNDSMQIVASRHGAYKRSTAGAVGACGTSLINTDKVIVAGDWNSENFDLYNGDGWNVCDSSYTLHLPLIDKKCSYQSIGLYCDHKTIYMIGTGIDKRGNRADLFRFLYLNEGNDIELKLMTTRYFHCSKGCSFRYGAGIRVTSTGEIQVYATQRRIKRQNTINIFGG